MFFNADELCEKLQTTDRQAKLAALEKLQQEIVATKSTSSQDIQQVFDGCYLNLLKCYSDRFESVREQSIRTVNVFMERMPPNDFHLLNVVATLTDRIGQQETLEESEEIRLLFVQQLLKLESYFINTGNKHSLEECYSDIVRILNKALRDLYPSVQREACACVALLASNANYCKFQAFSNILAKALYGMLNHKHSTARITAVNALGYVALHIDASGNALSCLIMEVSPLLMDPMPLVRRECGEMGVRLLLELRDRYSYFERIIPLVLCCLKDDSPEVREYIVPLWIKCGKQYYEENEAELSKQEIGDLPSPNYPIDVMRPTIGCRGLVQRSLRLLKLITRESSDWKENVRLHSLKLLYQFVLHAEATMTAKFFEIYADLARACRDTESVVVEEAFKVSDLLGRLLKYEDWCEHGFDGLERNAKEGYLICFYYMYTPALGVKFDDNLRLSKILIQSDFSQTLKPGFQSYILKMVETILAKTQCDIDEKQNISEFEEMHKNCYIATIKVMALALESEQTNGSELQDNGSIILKRIASRRSTSMDDVHEKFFKNALDCVENIDAPLDALSEPILLLYGLIKLVKFRESYLTQLQEKVGIVFEQCADDSKIKIFSAISIAMLDWQKTIKGQVEKSSVLLKEFATRIIEPHIQWHAGANAEAMRSFATATLCALSQGAPQEAGFVLPHFAKYMPTLMEDRAVVTRHYAIKCLNNFGDLQVDDLKPIAYACLQRINDPSSGIRILAASIIPKLKPKFGDEPSKNYEQDIWDTFLKRCMDLLFLHYDGPEVRLQAAIKQTVLEMSERYPELCKESYKRALASTHNCINLLELKPYLPSID
uniref:TOG domain-containing protein n=1 Tax=Glossina palpalis gambiensis TaxID=67801 RepID=A0A1B0BK07_9MUSC